MCDSQFIIIIPVKMQKSCAFHAHHNMAGTDTETDSMYGC